MSKKVNLLTGCFNAVEQLRLDVETGQLVIYDVKDVPPGIIASGYLNKCSSVAVAVSSSGHNDYVVIMPARPDYGDSGSGKVLDIDPLAFCFKRDSLDAYPTGAAFYHQDYSGRTSTVSGYDAYTLPQTVADIRANLVTGSQPISSSDTIYINSISHSIGKLTSILGTDISGWNQSQSVQINLNTTQSGISGSNAQNSGG